jgi:hypothetical protein
MFRALGRGSAGVLLLKINQGDAICRKGPENNGQVEALRPYVDEFRTALVELADAA